MKEYEYEYLIYTGDKRFYVTPGKKYKITIEIIDGMRFRHFIGDDGEIWKITRWDRKSDLKFSNLQDLREEKINKILE
jgi:hypothetical protein